ncbi:Calcium-dependent phospholipase A2, partial [Sciurus carolinensis]|nr:Calcium-dependent phospholipase A2 [Sciurus carolinensis]
PAVPGGLLDLKSMIEKVTGKDALKNYGFYGCYCGWGGRGTPKDGTDWCCWLHDLCYGRLEEEGCGIRTQSYQYRFARGRVTCGWELPEARSREHPLGQIMHSPGLGARPPSDEHGPFCPVGLCACDRKLVYCLKRNLWSYNPHYQYFPNIFCS